MPYIVYRTTKLATGGVRYHNPKQVSLAGRGLIQSTLRRLGVLGESDSGWTISASDLLQTANYAPDIHALVIDTAPRRPTVSLFQARSIVGYSYSSWTPIMLRLEQLFVDEPAPISTEETKREFNDDECERCAVRSILYLKGGYAEGDWNWGGNSRTTAALLWDDAWTFFRLD
jgi:hypothetical protein